MAGIPSQKPTHTVQEAAEARFPAGFSMDVQEDALLLQPKMEHEHPPGADSDHQRAQMTFGHPLPRVVPSPEWTVQRWTERVWSSLCPQTPQGFWTPWTRKSSPCHSHFFLLPKQFKLPHARCNGSGVVICSPWPLLHPTGVFWVPPNLFI